MTEKLLGYNLRLTPTVWVIQTMTIAVSDGKISQRFNKCGITLKVPCGNERRWELSCRCVHAKMCCNSSTKWIKQECKFGIVKFFFTASDLTNIQQSITKKLIAL
jgi:hypothetical protein